jgi:hypothetical protein
MEINSTVSPTPSISSVTPTESSIAISTQNASPISELDTEKQKTPPSVPSDLPVATASPAAAPSGSKAAALLDTLAFAQNRALQGLNELRDPEGGGGFGGTGIKTAEEEEAENSNR